MTLRFARQETSTRPTDQGDRTMLQQTPTPKPKWSAYAPGIGLAVGAAVGTAFGVVFGELALWTGFGTAVGLVVGALVALREGQRSS
jgi:uncharacterized membrane protein YoaK (UPF0700 family)